MRSTALGAGVLLAALPPASAVSAQAFKVGDRVQYNDFYGRHGGGWVPATVVLAAPSSTDRNWVNYKIVVDSDPARREQFVLSTEIRPAGASTAAAPPPLRAAPAPEPALPVASAPTRQPPGLSHCGNVQYKMRPLSKKRSYQALDGRQAEGWMIGPGDASPIGRWKLNVGVIPSKVGSEQRGGVRVDTYRITEALPVGSITISPGGAFSYVDVDRKAKSGRWVDLGQNIVELRGYDGEVFTASVWQCRIELQNPSGTRVWGGPL